MLSAHSAVKEKPKLLFIGGPTASGKSRIALEIASRIPSEIVNADSRQIYKQLRIGTSQPDQEELRAVPHHYYGFLEPDVPFTAADYERAVSALIPEIMGRNRLPLIVGGTGFYMKALLRGVWPVPPRSELLRKRLRLIHQRHDAQFLHKMLMRLDPASAALIAPPDTYRLIRALEICFQIGIRRSDLPRTQQERYNALKYFLDLPRAELHHNIRTRTERMFQQGWVQEVERLLTMYPNFEQMPAAKSLGYQEILRHLRGEMDLSQCRDTIIMKTRQYAKKQLTWFRNQDGFEPILPSGTPLYKMIDCVLQWYGN